MKTDKTTSLAMRDDILKLLSDNEVAGVSTAETVAQLSNGDEYLDLEALGKGVLHADGSATPMGSVLPKKAVQPATWTKILAKLATPAAHL